MCSQFGQPMSFVRFVAHLPQRSRYPRICLDPRADGRMYGGGITAGPSTMRDKPDDADSQAAIERNRQAVTRYANAWLAGDRATLTACYHEDFTLHYFGSNPLAG